jgi:hypothetical protein
MIWMLEGEIRQLQIRINQLEGSVLPQLISRLTRLEEPTGENATDPLPAGDSGSFAGASSNDAVAARAAPPFKLVLGERNQGISPAVAAALVGGPLHALLNRSCAAERSGAGSPAACGAGSFESSESAVGIKHRRHRDTHRLTGPAASADAARIDTAAAADLNRGEHDAGADAEVGAGVATAAVAGVGGVRLPHKRARVRGSRSPDRSADAACEASAAPHAVFGIDGDGGARSDRCAAAARGTVSVGPSAANSSRNSNLATATASGAWSSRPRRAAGLAAAAAIRIASVLEIEAAFAGCSRYDDTGSRDAGSDADGSSSDGSSSDDDGSSTESESESADGGEADDQTGSSNSSSVTHGRNSPAGGPARKRRVPARGGSAAAPGAGGVRKVPGHTCPHCGLGCASPNKLPRHIRTHTGEKLHACSQCEATFAQAENLRQHERSVPAGERPHACSHCEAAFAQVGSLRRHVRAVHFGERR